MFERKAGNFKERINFTKKFEELKRLASKVTELNEIVNNSVDEAERQTALDQMRAIRDECVRKCKRDNFLMPDFRDRAGFLIDI